VPDPYGSPLAAALRDDVLERFLRYVRVDTQSSRRSETTPSTAAQLELARLLADELRGLGLEEVELSEHGYVNATLPPSPAADGPTVGLLAHLDVSPDAPGSGVDPQVWRDYDGGELVLPGDRAQVLSPATSPLLGARVGHDIVTSDGTTLLGADDKAGVAEFMAAVAYLVSHPELPRPRTRIGFTVDEEVGHGADHFDLARFGAEAAYTLDGQKVGDIENETFSAVELTVTFRGVGVHPGVAKGKLVNAVRIVAAFLASLPPELSPEATDGRAGFVHPFAVEGSAERARTALILRDFDEELLAGHERLVRSLAERAAAAVPGAGVEIERWDQYANMRGVLDTVPHVVEAALEATRRAGLEPRLASIRGGTDGSQLTAMGLPTPNVFAGGNEFHSVREWVSVEDMAIAAATVVKLLEVWAERGAGRDGGPSAG
jgi:tripeptide aminopeptidase